MSFEIKPDYTKSFLLPPRLDDWVPRNHPARFIKEFVDGLNLASLGFRVRKDKHGRPNFSANLLLKVVLYGNFEGIRSTRKLEKMCYSDIGMIWLTGMERPDHNTIWRFISGNREAIKRVFKQSVLVAVEMGLVGMVLQAVDGSRIQAAASLRSVEKKRKLEKVLKELDELADESIDELERSESGEEGEDYGMPSELADKERLKEKIKESLKRLKEAGRDYISMTDMDSRLMSNGDGFVRPSYNSQVVVDEENRIVIAEDVVQEESENFLLVGMVDEAVSNLGEKVETVADAGYYSGEQLALAEERGYEVLVSIPDNSSVKYGFIDEDFDKSKFRYDRERDVYICPEGKELRYSGEDGYGKKYPSKVYMCKECGDCPSRSLCTRSKVGRRIKVPYFAEAIKRQMEKQRSEWVKRKMKRRKYIVEPVFGVIKWVMGFKRYTVWGLERVKAQWSLVCTVYNLRKIYRKWEMVGAG